MSNEDEIPATKRDIAALKTSVQNLAARVERLEQTTARTAIDQARLRGDFLDMKDDVGRLMEAYGSRLLKALEDHAGRTQDVDRRTLVFDRILADHERRIHSLESGRS